MRKAIGALVILIVAGIVLPPAYYTMVGESGPLDLPVLVINGEDDRGVPMKVAEDLYQRAQPDAKLIGVPGGSHMLPITHPDLLAQDLFEFTE